MGLLDGIWGFFDFIIKPLDKIAEYALRPLDYLEERPIFTLILLILIVGCVWALVHYSIKYNVWGVLNDYVGKFTGAKPESQPSSTAAESDITGTTVELYEHNQRRSWGCSCKYLL